MKALIQRVTKAKLTVDNNLISEISNGLVCYLGIGIGDSEKDLKWLANKVAGLRIFSDQTGKMNHSVKDLNYDILVVSQFTLYADTKKGFRPSFINAEKPDLANKMYEDFCHELIELGIGNVKKGVFGADMHIYQENSGPVTIMIDSREGGR
jgi:D-tyrosyl-tRNA(Tyr) deacylase